MSWHEGAWWSLQMAEGSTSSKTTAGALITPAQFVVVAAVQAVVVVVTVVNLFAGELPFSG